ncbi:MAG: hypothetical protein AMXMBFR61_26090 [Fimbriimonadales bacterium]
MRREGITLIELLVVIVILLALIAVALPVTHLVRSRSLLSGCASNLSQIGKAVLMYADDYHGWLPCYMVHSHYGTFILRDGSRVPRNYDGKPKEWRDSLAKYTKSNEVFWCPADRFRGQLAQSVSDAYSQDARRQLYTSYIIAHMLYIGKPHRVDPDGNLRVRLSALPLGPSRTIYLEEPYWFPGPIINGAHYYLTHHGMVGNLQLLDGSVRKIRVDGDFSWAEEPR